MIDWVQLYFHIKSVEWILGVILIIGILIWQWFEMRGKNND